MVKKKVLFGIIAAAIISVSLIGCTNPNSNKAVNDIELSRISNNSVMESYKAVLQNKAEFFSTDNEENLYLNKFLTNK